MKKYIIGAIIIVIGVFVFFQTQKEKPTEELKGLVSDTAFPIYTFLNATTTTATSTNATNNSVVGSARVKGANKVTFVFSRGDTTGTGNSGSSSFNVAVSADGTNWVGYNKLIDNVVNSNSQTLTRVAAVSLSGTTTKFYSMDLDHDLINYVRCGVVETTDGEHTCKAFVQY